MSTSKPSGHTDFYTLMNERNLVHQVSGDFQKALTDNASGYIHFEPTGPSLNIGSLQFLIALRRFAEYGYTPMVVLGSGTAQIGDPSASTPPMSKCSAESNADKISTQLSALIGGKPFIVNNSMWLSSLNLVSFLRDIGKYMPVASMMDHDPISGRMKGRDSNVALSEFCYSALRAYDFLEMHSRFGCRIQIGGSDQWGNFCGGRDLIKRVMQQPAHVMSISRVTKSDGSSIGKSDAGTIWLDPSMTSPFKFYQYFVNLQYADFKHYLNALTTLPTTQISQTMSSHEGHPSLREPQKLLAREVTRFVHGEEEMTKAEEMSRILFDEGAWSKAEPEELRAALACIEPQDHAWVNPCLLGTEDASLIDLLVLTNLANSRTAARDAIMQTSIRVNDRVIQDPKMVFDRSDLLFDDSLVIRKGKMTYKVVHWTEIRGQAIHESRK